MLVLTRSTGERLVIGDEGEIVLTILDVRGTQVRIGVQAPRHIAVHREEIFERIRAEEKQKKQELETVDE